ncbi:MAG TPA: class I SAM-dependent methyltransferase, partial [Nitrospiria bacterium]|nr:class I SAM-dependent methyltransferase [Nitrospiria bacterium]
MNMFRSIAKAMGSRYEKLRPKRNSAQEVFTRIFEKKHWYRNESVSGPGSDVSQTQVLIERLPTLFEDLHVGTVLDIPCGDFNWMRHVNLSRVHYIGADIVADI